MATLHVGHVLATVVFVANVHTKLTFVLLLIWAHPFVELETYESPIWQLRRAAFGQIVQHLLDCLTLSTFALFKLAFVRSVGSWFLRRSRLLRLARRRRWPRWLSCRQWSHVT